MGCKITVTAQDKTTHCIVNRPSWEVMRKFYQELANTKTTPALFLSLFEEKTIIEFKLDNSCATRVSLALVNAGIKNLTPGFTTYSEAAYKEFKSKRIITSAVNFITWLTKNWGQPEIKFKTDQNTGLQGLKNKIGARKGVFLFKALNTREFGASGHITLWDGLNVITGSSYTNVAYADEYQGEVYFWELK
jgi:hypothetical protein